jgi:uncharacterized protein (TIGR02246 family)
VIPELLELQEFAKSYTAAWCSQEPSSVAAHFSPQGSLTINDSAASIGQSAIAEAARDFMTTFPDLQVVMNDVRVTGEHAEYHWTLSGTAVGRDGTGNPVRISGFEVWSIGEDGLIVESRGRFDADEYQRQLERGIAR